MGFAAQNPSEIFLICWFQLFMDVVETTHSQPRNSFEPRQLWRQKAAMRAFGSLFERPQLLRVVEISCARARHVHVMCHKSIAIWPTLRYAGTRLIRLRRIDSATCAVRATPSQSD
jgi:hypothetical protein